MAGNGLELDGRRIVVTGAAGAIGREVAVEAARQGARVCAVDLPGDGLAVTGKLLGQGGLVREADLTDADAISGLCADLASSLGGVDAAVFAAGVLVRRAVDSVTEADWDTQVAVNLKSVFFLSRSLASMMRQNSAGGAMVMLASQGWWTGGLGGSVVYAATKGGVVSLTRGLAREWAGDQIRVNAVAPGFVDTPMLRTGLSGTAVDGFVDQVPLARLGTPAEVARVILFLVSDGASYMTGTTLSVSGGQLMY